MKSINVILALLVSLGIALGVFEGGLRLMGFGPPALNTEFDPELGWRARPDVSIQRSSSEFDLTLATDALGLRDDFESADDIAKPSGVFRILMLGDSFVNGYTVERKDLFVDRLESAYAAEGRNIEVVNGGMQGYSTDQQLLWLRRHGKALSPDLVIAFPFENDIWWNAQGEYAGEPKPQLDASGEPIQQAPLAEPHRSFLDRTATGRLPKLFERPPTMDVEGRKVPVEMTSRLVKPPAATLDAEARTAGLLAALAEETGRLGAAFIACPIPSRAHVEASAAAPDASTDPARPFRVLSNACEGLGNGMVDIAEGLKAAHAKGDRVYYRHDFHLNPSGNGVVARVLHEKLDRLGLVPALIDRSKAAPPTAGASGSNSSIPRWPLWYLALTLILGTLYSRTYPDESKGAAYLRVGLLLAVVFTVALGVTALVGSLSPVAGRILLAGLVIGLLTFVAYKLGDRVGTILELLRAFTMRGHWYLMPLLTVLLTVGSLLVVAASSPLVAPFIYTLF